jgi:tetratricopeptide (TPR) repeat protein
MNRIVFLVLASLILGISAVAQSDRSRTISELRALNVEVQVLFQKQKFDEAFTLASKAQKIAESNLPAQDELAIATLSNLAEIQYARKKKEAAEELFRKSIAVKEKVFGSEDVRLTFPLERLASLLASGSETREALAILQRVKQLKKKTYGKEDLRTVRAMANLGRLYIKDKQYERAEPLLLEALALSDAAEDVISELSFSIFEDYRYSISQSKSKTDQEKRIDELTEKRGILVLRFDALLERIIRKGTPSVAYKNQEIVSILVVIDERGNVVSAKSLRDRNVFRSWEDAAIQTSFKPASINGKPIKIMGTLKFFP